MRVLHVSQYCHAGSVGGTERYLLDLVRGLSARGASSKVGWLTTESGPSFLADGVEVHPLPSAAMRVDAPPDDLHSAAKALITEFRPDVVHFHTFGLAEALVAELSSEQGLPYLFTYHSPGWTCRREDLLIWGGTQPCDGQVRTLRCASCKLQQRFGGPAAAGYMGALASAPLDWMLRRSSNVDLRRKVCFLSDTRRFGETLRRFLARCSGVISCSEWGVSVLALNGAAAERITVIPQGVPNDLVLAQQVGETSSVVEDRVNTDDGRPIFTVGYVGRVTPVKGVDVLLQGFSRVRGDDLRLRVFGVDAAERTLAALNARLGSLAAHDHRIELRPKVPLAEVASAYRSLDVLAIPSITLETGPLVLFEALHLGVPVFASNRIGHPALLEAGGMLVDPNTPEGWRRALESAAAEFRSGAWPGRLKRLRSMIALQTMDGVAGEMERRYAAACATTARRG